MKNRYRKVTERMADVIAEMDLDTATFTTLIKAKDQLHLFDNIPDPRRRPGSCIYSFKSLLILILLATVEDGFCCPHSIAEHIEIKRDCYFELGLLPSPHGSPSHDLIEDILEMVDSEELAKNLAESLYEFTSALHPEDRRSASNMVQIDGKEMRGTGRSKETKNPVKNTNMLNLWDPLRGICLLSVPVDSKRNEIPGAQKILYEADLKRRYVTFDALHTQDLTLDIIQHKGGWYVAPLKNSQKLSLNPIRELFEDLKMERFIKKETREKRDFDVLRLSGKRSLEKFPGAKYAVKMVSRTRSETNPLVMYFISNSSSVEGILSAIEMRWDIENGLHQIKDSALIGEDKFRSQNRTAQQNIAILNNFITVIVRLVQASRPGWPLSKAKKMVRHYPLECLKLVCEMISDESFISLMKAGIKKETARQIGEGKFDWSSLK